jgi:hypothetical protein
MKRLGNLKPQRERSTDSEPILSLSTSKSNNIKLNVAAVNKLGAHVGDRIDVLQGDVEGEYYIAKAVEAAIDAANEALPKESRQELPGKKLSKSLSFTSTLIYPMLKSIGVAFEVSDQTTEFEGLRWNRLVPTSADKAVQDTETNTVVASTTVGAKKEEVEAEDRF